MILKDAGQRRKQLQRGEQSPVNVKNQSQDPDQTIVWWLKPDQLPAYTFLLFKPTCREKSSKWSDHIIGAYYLRELI